MYDSGDYQALSTITWVGMLFAVGVILALVGYGATVLVRKMVVWRKSLQKNG